MNDNYYNELKEYPRILIYRFIEVNCESCAKKLRIAQYNAKFSQGFLSVLEHRNKNTPDNRGKIEKRTS